MTVSGYANPSVREHHGRKIFQVHLVHDPGVGRYDAEISKRRLTPAEQCVALLVALKLEQRIVQERIVRTELVHLHRMIDNEVGRDQRIGEFGVSAHGCKRVAHRREIHNARNAREILKQNASGAELDFFCRPADRPASHVLDIVLLYGAIIFETQQVFEQHFDAVR